MGQADESQHNSHCCVRFCAVINDTKEGARDECQHEYSLLRQVMRGN
jgi:hypothetical protein